MDPKIYDIEERLVNLAGVVIAYSRLIARDDVGKYLADQMMRAMCSAALHYGECQGAGTTKDSIHKASMSLKELKETRVSVKISMHADSAHRLSGQSLLLELEEVIAIIATIIKNKRS